ncbi:SMI1/KNR4 family protein [Plantactinospora sp. CA-294935]|uniref:SMI1/KNR4 family protein n=1 Tax=Plantactinospora sp. CA-294935 TaxID=3240012 RepID=UPI003D9227EE
MIVVNELPVPPVLVEAVNNGHWAPPADKRLMSAVFGEDPDYPAFYSLKAMVEQTEGLFNLDLDILTWYLGDVDGVDRPGVISTDRTVLIGDLGLERPFALDYSESIPSPGVVFFAENGRWRQVAPDVASLLVLLKIS